MTSKSTPLVPQSSFSAGPGSLDVQGVSHAFLEETEVTLDRLHRNMQQAMGGLPSPAPDLPENVGADNLQPDNLDLLMVLVATVAGALLVIFTGF